MAQSMTIPEIKRLVQKVVWRTTGAKLTLRNIKIEHVVTSHDEIFAVWFNTYSNIGAISYYINWHDKIISIIIDRNLKCEGIIRFDGRY